MLAVGDTAARCACAWACARARTWRAKAFSSGGEVGAVGTGCGDGAGAGWFTRKGLSMVRERCCMGCCGTGCDCGGAGEKGVGEDAGLAAGIGPDGAELNTDVFGREPNGVEALVGAEGPG